MADRRMKHCWQHGLSVNKKSQTGYPSGFLWLLKHCRCLRQWRYVRWQEGTTGLMIIANPLR
ncbi:hypothetical protein [Prevotella histicola]